MLKRCNKTKGDSSYGKSNNEKSLLQILIKIYSFVKVKYDKEKAGK